MNGVGTIGNLSDHHGDGGRRLVRGLMIYVFRDGGLIRRQNDPETSKCITRSYMTAVSGLAIPMSIFEVIYNKLRNNWSV